MPTYLTKIKSSNGTTREQMLTVPSEDQLEEYLSRLDGFVIDCSRHEGKEPLSKSGGGEKSVAKSHRFSIAKSQLLIFTWHLHTMVEAGVPLLKALEVVSNQVEDANFNIVLSEVISLLQKGESLGESLKKYPRCFPSDYVHMIEVGELSGHLDTVLQQLAVHGEKQQETKSKLKSALAYPVVLITASTGVVFFLMAFVLPRIAKMFAGHDLELPMLTKVMLAIGTTMRSNVLLLLALGIALVVGFVFAKQTPNGRDILSRIALTIPIFGSVYQKYILAGYCKTLALLQNSGVNLMVSLSVAREGLKNVVLSNFFEKVEKNVEEGSSLAAEFSQCKYIPEMVTSMIGVGEETGKLSEMLYNVARFYEKDIDRTIDVLPKIIEPTVIVGMTGVVGLIAASIFIPLSQLTQGVG